MFCSRILSALLFVSLTQLLKIWKLKWFLCDLWNSELSCCLHPIMKFHFQPGLPGFRLSSLLPQLERQQRTWETRIEFKALGFDLALQVLGEWANQWKTLLISLSSYPSSISVSLLCSKRERALVSVMAGQKFRMCYTFCWSVTLEASLLMSSLLRISHFRMQNPLEVNNAMKPS